MLSCIVGDKIGVAGIENRKADDMNQVVADGKKDAYIR